MSGGWNPVAGRDGGSRPPLAPFGASTSGQGQAYIPHFWGPLWGHGTLNHPQMIYQAGTYYPYFAHANGVGNTHARLPQGFPNVDQSMPAAQMTNSSGGVGCEPGYNYFFPAEHTKCHVFHSTTPPWQLPRGSQVQFKAAHIPCTVTLEELLKGFGCNNPVAKKNKCFEIVPGGNGIWYKGISFCGGDKDMMKKTVKEVGWDMSRSGLPNEKPVVCLWFCKG